ncbi:hypothetical protein CPLU01_12251, partial [Colletotrichum plurivorum]
NFSTIFLHTTTTPIKFPHVALRIPRSELWRNFSHKKALELAKPKPLFAARS